MDAMSRESEKRQGRLASCDPIWSRMREEAEVMAGSEPAMASFIHASVLTHDRFEEALAYHLAKKIGNDDIGPLLVREIFQEAYEADPTIGQATRADLSAVFERDPACHTYVQAYLFFKGFAALQSHRVAHWLWTHERKPMALFFQSRVSELFAVDIHPAARFGRGVFVDHATGLVVGETAVVEDDVSMLHGVTLGGTGKADEDRHPKVRRGVLLGAGAKVLGNIEVGEYSRVGAGSVVLKAVPPYATVAGVPARVIGTAEKQLPSQDMNQLLEGCDFQI
jgi:serine O-acetyltransferase